MTDIWIDRAATHRVLEGVRKYGVIDLKTDKRCLLREATEELLDAMNYLKWSYQQGRLNEKDWMSMDGTIRYIITLIEKSCTLGKEEKL